MDMEGAIQRADEAYKAQAQTRGLLAIDGDKDKAAQAVKLGEQTGADPNMIYGNQDQFTNEYKSYLNQEIIKRDPRIVDYINNYRMGALVSKDDWHNLSNFNDKFDAMGPHLPGSRATAIAARQAVQSFDTSSLLGWMDDVNTTRVKEGKEAWPIPTIGTTPFSYLAWSAVSAAPVLLARSFHAGLEGLKAGFVEGYKGLGGTDQGAQQFARDMTGMAESYLMGTSGVHAPHITYADAVTNRMIDAIRAAKPYIKAGERPPVGLHPFWDEVLAAEKKGSMKAYDEVIDAARKSETRELDPNGFAALVRGHQKGSMYIDADAVLNLYKEKMPEPGDGILGDVPGIAQQIERARTHGEDIEIPWEHWTSKVKDEVVDSLRDDLRWRPGDMTLKEAEATPPAKEVMGPPEEILTPEQKWQAEFDLAQKEFQERWAEAPAEAKPEPPVIPPKPEPPETPEQRGVRLGAEYQERLKTPEAEPELIHALSQVAGDKIVPNEMGKAVRWALLHDRPDIAHQAFEVADRVNPALAAKLRADAEAMQVNKDAMDSVKSEMAQRPLFPEGWGEIEPEPRPRWPALDELLASGEWERLGRTMISRPVKDWTRNEAKILEGLQAILDRLAPGGRVALKPSREIRMGEPPTPVTGGYVSYVDRHPVIAFLINAIEVEGTMRHEILHHLRDYNFFTKEEWATLVDAAKKSWIKEHNVISRYPNAGAGLIVEEAVAAGYKAWALARETTSPIGKVFQRIHDFFTNIKSMIKQAFGKELTPEDVFTGIESGMVGRRTLREPLREGTFDIREMAQRPEAPGFELPAIEEGKPPMFAPGVLGPKENYARYMRLIDKINSKEVRKLYDDAYREEQKRLTPEWDKAAAEIYSAVFHDIDNRPDFRVSAFLRNGKFGDQVIPPNARKIDPKWLTPEQKAQFPKAWLAKGGNKPDEMAGGFGYRTGKEMVDDIIRFEKEKGEDKPALYKDKVVASEVERRMRQKFGDLDENIIQAAREHAIGIEQFDLLHEEYLRLGEMHGQQFPLTKENFKENAARSFNDAPQRKTELINYTRQIGKAGRAAETAWLKGDVPEAFRTKQLQLQLQAEAELAKKFEKEKKQFESSMKRTNLREPAGISPEYVNWIHDIRDRIGRPAKRDRADIDININRHEEKTLKDFVEKRNTAGLPEGWEKSFDVDYNPVIPVWEALLDPKFTIDVETTTVGEFRAINNSIQALMKHGREEKTALAAGEKRDRNRLIADLVGKMDEIRGKKIQLTAEGERVKGPIRRRLMPMVAGLMQMEGIWERFDRGQVGLFTKTFAIPFAKAGNEFRLLHRDYSRRLSEIGREHSRGVDLDEVLPNNVFKEPFPEVPKELREGIPDPAEFVRMTRSSLRGAMLNIGNKSNLEKLARGWGSTPEKVMEYVHMHATAKDWAFAREVGKVYDDIGKLEDTLAMNMSGITVHKLPLDPVMMPDGTTVPGWYYPMVYDRQRGGGRKVGMDNPPLIRAMTERGFEEPRTNYIAPVSLDINPVPGHIGRRLRNIAFREIITDAQKVFEDKSFRNGMNRNIGPEFTNLLDQYLRDLAGMRTPTGSNSAALNAFVEGARVNTIGLLIGWNPGTVMKHTPTAYMQSFKELRNPLNMLAATKDLWQASPEVMKSNSKWMMEGGKVGSLDWKGSGELQGRMQHWQDTLGGATEIINWDLSLMARARLSALQKGAWMVAKSDLWASKTLWLAKYREVMEDNPHMTIEKAHSEAVDMADRAVRRTHGSTAITSRPEFMRSENAFAKGMTSLYGFFNHIFNRQYRMAWKSRELMSKVKAGEPVAKDVWDLTTDFMLYVGFPAFIEEMVTPLFNDEKHSLGYRLFMPLLHPLGASMPIVREVAHAVYTGHDPAMGILTSGVKSFSDMARGLKKGPDFYNFGDTLQHAIALGGVSFGLGNAQAGRWAKFGYNYFVTKSEQPKSFGEWYNAFRYGTARERRH